MWLLFSNFVGWQLGSNRRTSLILNSGIRDFSMWTNIWSKSQSTVTCLWSSAEKHCKNFKHCLFLCIKGIRVVLLHAIMKNTCLKNWEFSIWNGGNCAIIFRWFGKRILISMWLQTKRLIVTTVLWVKDATSSRFVIQWTREAKLVHIDLYPALSPVRALLMSRLWPSGCWRFE